MNLNTFFLALLKDPHWRPRWKYFHWTIGAPRTIPAKTIPAKTIPHRLLSLQLFTLTFPCP